MTGKTLMRASPEVTFFRGRSFITYNWTNDAVLDTEEDIKLLSLLLPRIDAACMNPLDPDMVWFFQGDNVVDYRVSKALPIAAMPSFDGSTPAKLSQAFLDGISTRKIKDHPIFGALPSGFQSDLTGLVLDPRTYADTGGHTTAAPNVTSAGVVVAVDDGGAVTAGGALVVPVGQSVQLSHSLSFDSAGTYHATATFDDGGTDRGAASGPWSSTVARASGRPVPGSAGVDYVVTDRTQPETLLVSVNASGTPAWLVRLVITIRMTQPRRSVLYERRLMLYAGEMPTDGVPLVHVFKGSSYCVLRLTSLRTAEIAVQPVSTTPAGNVEHIFNGADASADSIYQISGNTVQTHVPGPKSASVVTSAPTTVPPKWGTVFKGSLPPWAAVPVRLHKTAKLRCDLTPNGCATVSQPEELRPPETVVAIPGRRPASVSPDFATWVATIARLFPCKFAAAPEERVRRMRAIVARITTKKDLPDFLRTFVAVRIVDGTRELVYYAMPDFFSVGTEAAFVRAPLTENGGQKVVDWYNDKTNGPGCELVQVTGKMALQIFIDESTQRLSYRGMDIANIFATEFTLRQQAMTEAERGRFGYVLGALTAGHRKEVVVGADMGRGIAFWGGVTGVDPATTPVRKAAPVEIKVANPHFDDEHPAGNFKPHPVTHPHLSDGQPTHPGDVNHDEYALGRRVVHGFAWFRDKAKSVEWEKRDLRTFFNDPALSTLVASLPFDPAVRRYPDFDTQNKGLGELVGDTYKDLG